MPLTPIEIPTVADPTALSTQERTLVGLAGRAVERLEREQPQLSRLLQRSDPDAFCTLLRALRSEDRLRGPRFCEWGSGIGLFTALAAINGFDAVGIEADPILVGEAQALFRDDAQGAKFALGSFVPPQISERFQVVGTYGATIWEPSTTRDPYAALGVSCADFDLIYAYPWPREISLYEALFEHCASPKALLWLYIQGSAPRLLEKVS